MTTREGFVYVIGHPSFDGFVKVGRAFNPESRLAGYQTGCPRRAYELHHAVYFPDAHRAEGEMHARLWQYQAEGEWFELPVREAINAINQLREIV